MKIVIAGDFFISDNYKNTRLIDISVQELFRNSDYKIINLEAPIIGDDPNNKILKTGPHLRCSEDVVMPYLKKLEVDMVTLANNHILDYGVNGLNETINTLNKNDISYIGAGSTVIKAAKPITVEREGIRIAILNFAENEWSNAREDNPGANPLDIIENVKQIKKSKATHDKVICIIHGGHEYSHLPSPRIVKQYRFYAENGADAIVSHHTHCIGGYEVYRNVPILYGLGNFIFTINSLFDVWYTGLISQLKIEKGSPISFELFPVKQEKKTFLTSLTQQEDKDRIMLQISNINDIISVKETLKNNWEDWIKINANQYINYFSITNAIGNRYIRAGLFKIGFGKIFLNIRYFKTILNLLRCESHRDHVEATIEEYIKRK